MLATHPQKIDRPAIFWELTRSICPECKVVIDAQILLRDGKVFMRKRCPAHGWFDFSALCAEKPNTNRTKYRSAEGR